MSNDLKEFFKLLAEEKAKDPKTKTIKQVKENLKEDLGSLFAQFDAIKNSSTVPQEVEDKIEEIVEDISQVEQQKIQEQGLPTPIGVVPKEQLQPEVDLNAVDKFLKGRAEPNDPGNKQFDDLNKKLKFIELWISKIQNAGPGSGAADVITLDHQTTLVTTATHTISRKDYYVGVNYAGMVTITLPTIAKNGRYIIIKDESGRCSRFPIIVNGNVDNDVDGFILRVDGGGVQMIYRDGWRIV